MGQLPSQRWTLLETLLNGYLPTDFSSVWAKPSFTRKIFNLILRGRAENQTPTSPLPLQLARLLCAISNKCSEHHNQCKLNISCREMSRLKAQPKCVRGRIGAYSSLYYNQTKNFYALLSSTGSFSTTDSRFCSWLQ